MTPLFIIKVPGPMKRSFSGLRFQGPGYHTEVVV